MPQDFPPFLAAACTLFLAVAFRVHDGSKSWAREKLFENGLSEEASSPAISRHTSGKSTSTPASIRLVDITRQVEPSRSLIRISFNTLDRCSGVMRVDR